VGLRNWSAGKYYLFYKGSKELIIELKGLRRLRKFKASQNFPLDEVMTGANDRTSNMALPT
jgi:hypothetical protein